MNKVFSNKALPPGTVLREWRLEQVLGVGGFGIVYRGRGIYFDELVAIKEYFPSAISDRQDGDTVVPTNSAAEEVHALGLKKFVEEAKLLWNLSKPTRHPNIVSVRSLFEIHGTAYMVMDFEDGLALSDMLKQGKTFSQEALFAILRPIAEGLDRAHRVGVLHRDIKPANILVSEDGRPVLIDFGSARFESGEATSTTVTFHTPPYAAIEQYVKTYAQGPWTDIYALGVAMYECITGTKPPEVLERMHGGEGKNLADRNIPGFTRAFLRAIDEAMVIRPGDRPQSIPQWLALFDLPDDADIPAADTDDEATRFASFVDLPEEIIAIVPPVPPVEPVAAAAPPAAQPAAANVAAQKPAATSPGKQNRTPLFAGLGVVAALVAGGGYLATRSGGPVAPQAGQVQPAVQPAPTINVADTSALATLPAAFDALVADARRFGRPASEVSKLAAASAALKDLAGQLSGLKTPDAVKAQGGKMADLVHKASADFAGSIARDASNRTATLARTVPWADPRRPQAAAGQPAPARAAAGSVKAAFDAINAASAAASQAADPAATIAAARQAASASARLSPAIARMAGFSLASRRSELTAIIGRARALEGRIVELSKAGKPGLFASRDKRDSWKLRQDNVKRAQADIAELDRLNAEIQTANTPQAFDSALASAKRALENLSAIEASSVKAAPQGN